MRAIDIFGVFVAVMLSAYIGLQMIGGMIRENLIGVDFFTFVRNVQQPLSISYAPVTDAPFAYPPTMPLIFWPVSYLGFAGFMVLSTIFLLMACRKYLPTIAMIIAGLSLPFANVIVCGQLTALVVSLSLFGLAAQDRRLAGLLFAVAAAFKPQLVAFIPFYLLAIRDWRAFLFAGGGYAVIVFASVLAFGVAAWADWLGSLANYRDVVTTGDVFQWVITPIGMAERAGLPTLPIAFLCAAGAVALAFLPYKSPIEALSGLTVASLLVLPYGLAYDTLGIVPLAALQISRGRWLPIIPYSLIWPIAAIGVLLIDLVRLVPLKSVKATQA